MCITVDATRRAMTALARVDADADRELRVKLAAGGDADAGDLQPASDTESELSDIEDAADDGSGEPLKTIAAANSIQEGNTNSRSNVQVVSLPSPAPASPVAESRKNGTNVHPEELSRPTKFAASTPTPLSEPTPHSQGGARQLPANVSSLVSRDSLCMTKKQDPEVSPKASTEGANSNEPPATSTQNPSVAPASVDVPTEPNLVQAVVSSRVLPTRVLPPTPETEVPSSSSALLSPPNVSPIATSSRTNDKSTDNNTTSIRDRSPVRRQAQHIRGHSAFVISAAANLDAASSKAAAAARGRLSVTPTPAMRSSSSSAAPTPASASSVPTTPEALVRPRGLSEAQWQKLQATRERTRKKREELARCVWCAPVTCVGHFCLLLCCTCG